MQGMLSYRDHGMKSLKLTVFEKSKIYARMNSLSAVLGVVCQDFAETLSVVSITFPEDLMSIGWLVTEILV
jgi:hypothetical protein